MYIHCNDFPNCKDESIHLDLDEIFDENGDYLIDSYNNNVHVKNVILFRSKSNHIKIGHYFLSNCSNLTTIDLTSFSNVTSIGNHFLSRCPSLTAINLTLFSNITRIGNRFLSNCASLTRIDFTPLPNVTSIGDCFLFNCAGLTTINLTPLLNVTSIGNWFLSHCPSLTTIDLTPFSNVTSVGNHLLSSCAGLTTIDLTPLSNITSIGGYFLNSCTGLTTIIIESENEHLLKILKYIPDVTILLNKDKDFKSFKQDIERMKNDKKFTKNVLTYLDIKHNKKLSNKKLIKKVNILNEQYNKLLDNETLAKCRNDIDPISLEELKNIPMKRIVLIDEINDTYNGFDILLLREHLFGNKKEKYMNPLTTNILSDQDIKKLKYFT